MGCQLKSRDPQDWAPQLGTRSLVWQRAAVRLESGRVGGSDVSKSCAQRCQLLERKDLAFWGCLGRHAPLFLSFFFFRSSRPLAGRGAPPRTPAWAPGESNGVQTPAPRTQYPASEPPKRGAAFAGDSGVVRNSDVNLESFYFLFPFESLARITPCVETSFKQK